jgi:hypothetical protein
MAQERQHFQAQLAAQLEAQRTADADVATAGGRGLLMQGAARRLLGVLEVAQGLNGLAEVEFNHSMQFALSWVTVSIYLGVCVCVVAIRGWGVRIRGWHAGR